MGRVESRGGQRPGGRRPGRGSGDGDLDRRRNPLVDDLRQTSGSTVYAEAAKFGGQIPTLFTSGDLPVATSSGLDPRELLRVPWYGRHAVAAAPTLAEAQDLIDDLSEPGHLRDEYEATEGVRDYRARVEQWALGGVEAAAQHRRDVEAAQVVQAGQPAGGDRVAAAGGVTTTDGDDGDDDAVYAAVYGQLDRQEAEKHVEHLGRIAAGTALDAPLSQRQARARLEEYAAAAGSGVVAASAGDGARGRFSVPPDAARKVLDRLDRDGGRR